MKWASNPVTQLSEIATVCGNNFRLIKKTKNEGDQKLCVVLMKRASEGTMSCALGMKWLICYSEVGDHDIYLK